MTWLEALPAVPTLGIRWNHRYFVAGELLAPLRSFMERLQAKNTMLSLGNPNPFDTTIQCSNGYEFVLHTDGLVISYSYERAATLRRGKKGLPEATPITARGYGELVDEVLGYTLEVVDGVKTKEISADRLGLVARVPVARDEAPPGLQRFLGSLDAVTGLEPVNSSCRLTGRIVSGQGLVEQCHHHVKPVTTPDGATTLDIVLDYQRLLDPPIPLDRVQHSLREFVNKALDYFERFGSGI